MMKSPTVRIDKLHLRVPGLSPDQARRLGTLVGRRIAASPPATKGSQVISAISVRLRTRGTGTPEQMADDIASHVRGKLE
jgi:hypothetical protein